MARVSLKNKAILSHRRNWLKLPFWTNDGYELWKYSSIILNKFYINRGMENVRFLAVYANGLRRVGEIARSFFNLEKVRESALNGVDKCNSRWGKNAVFPACLLYEKGRNGAVGCSSGFTPRCYQPVALDSIKPGFCPAHD